MKEIKPTVNNSSKTAQPVINPAAASRLRKSYDQHSDRQLTLLARSGDADAASYLLGVRHAGIFRALAFKYHGDDPLDDFATTLLAQVYFRLENNRWKNIAAHDGNIAFYLYGVVRNTAIKVFKEHHNIHNSSVKERPISTLDMYDRQALDNKADNSATVDGLRLRHLDDALKLLSPTQRYVVEQHFFQGCSLAAIGHEMPMHLRPAELRGFAKDLSEHKVRRILNDAKDRIAAYINDRIDSQAFAA